MTNKNNNKGFTLVELLCTIVIVLLLTSCMTLGIGLATKTFGSVFGAAKAQTLASTLNYLISDELRTAADVKEVSGNVRYTSENYGADVTITVGTDSKNAGRIVVETSDTEDTYNAAKNVYTFGTSNLYGKNLQVKNDGEDAFSIKLSDDKKTFTVHYAIVDKNHPDALLAIGDFQVKSMEGS